jgi:lipoate-protein ligase A
LDCKESLSWYHSGGEDPALDLAREEVLLERAAGGPFLLTWSWERPVLVLGFGQGREGVDFGYCRRQKITVLRRCSGGTGVIHRGDLGASLVLPPGHPWALGIRALYERFVEAFREVLDGCGVPVERPIPPPAGSGSHSPVCFEDRLAETLLSKDRKVLGCAQARRAAGILVHGTLLLCENSSLYSGVFRLPVERVSSALGPVPGGPHPVETLSGRLAQVLARDMGCELKETPLPGSVERAARALLGLRRADARWHPVLQGSN